MKMIYTANKGKTNKAIRSGMAYAKSKTFYILFCTFYLLLLSLLSGCGNKFFDPTQIGRFRPTPAVNVILDSLGVAEEQPPAWEGAEEPRPTDIIGVKTDYVFRAGDIVRISIFELYYEGVQVINDYIVTETGKISIPNVGVIQAAGLTEIQLEEQIRQILSPGILKDPAVAVTLVGSQQRTFSILGNGVPAPGRYVIPRYNFRLTDALATAGGARQFNVSNIYVSRYVEEKKDLITGPMELELIEPETIEPQIFQPESYKPERWEELIEPERELLEVITPLAKHHWPKSNVVIASAELATYKERAADVAWPEVTAPPPSHKKPLKELAGPEKTDKPVTIQDILKTLSERARQEKADKRIDLEEGLKPFAEPITPEAADKPIDVEEALKSFAEPTVPRAIEEPTEYEGIGVWGPSVEPAAPEMKKERIEETEPGRIEWIFQDGKWVPVQIGPPPLPKPFKRIVEIEHEEAFAVPPELLVPAFEMAEEAKMRVLKIPVDKLLAGDPRYNIVIKAGDSIHVPVDIIGEFCIMGNVNYQGYINITGRPMTLKMAVAAAGGLGPLAWPKYCEVVRRIGKDKEEIVMVDLDKIASGEQPDFFIKPNDLINVGTHATSIWRAVLRNAFRATYGFGFIYDRNFAARDYLANPEALYNPVTPWNWDSVF